MRWEFQFSGVARGRAIAPRMAHEIRCGPAWRIGFRKATRITGVGKRARGRGGIWMDLTPPHGPGIQRRLIRAGCNTTLPGFQPANRALGGGFDPACPEVDFRYSGKHSAVFEKLPAESLQNHDVLTDRINVNFHSLRGVRHHIMREKYNLSVEAISELFPMPDGISTIQA